MNCKSTLLEISNGKTRGRIYIERGEIIHADADGLIGESARHTRCSRFGAANSASKLWISRSAALSANDAAADGSSPTAR
jgi:hypothetical protein